MFVAFSFTVMKILCKKGTLYMYYNVHVCYAYFRYTHRNYTKSSIVCSVCSLFMPLDRMIGDIITYLVISRPYIEICQVGKIYGRRGGAKPSIYFTNPTYFYVRSGTDQISVLFYRGPLFVYAVLRKIRKFIPTADKFTTSMLARKCEVAHEKSRHARRHIMMSLTPV